MREGLLLPWAAGKEMMSTVEETGWSDVANEEGQAGALNLGPDRAAPTPRPEDPRRTAVVNLAGKFVGGLIGDAREARKRDHPSAPEIEVDWEALWALGSNATSLDLAVGRVVAAAGHLAAEIAHGRSPGITQPSRPEASARVEPAPYFEQQRPGPPRRILALRSPLWYRLRRVDLTPSQSSGRRPPPSFRRLRLPRHSSHHPLRHPVSRNRSHLRAPRRPVTLGWSCGLAAVNASPHSSPGFATRDSP